MRFPVPLRRAAVSVAALSAALAASSAMAIEVTVNDVAADLAGTLFEGVEGVSDIEATIFSGAFDQFGTFTNDRAIYGLPQEGVVLSTGNVADYGAGPNLFGGNLFPFEGGEEFPGGDVFAAAAVDVPAPAAANVPAFDAQDLLPQVVDPEFEYFDIAHLSIDFEADEAGTITFFGVFGSEEFPFANGSDVIDGFGLFANGVNVAVVNDETITAEHSDFLGARPVLDFLPPIDGEFPFEEGGGPVLDEVETLNETLEPGDPRLALVTGTELNGVIAPDVDPILRFDVPVVAGANTIDIIIADTGDDVVDSTVYLSSLQPQEFDLNGGASEFAPILPDDQNPEDGIFVFTLPGDLDFENIFFIDPPVAIGYTYTVEDAEFAAIQAPTFFTIADADGYQIDLVGVDETTVFDLIDLTPDGLLRLAPGQTLDIAGLGVTEFVLSGIDASLMLDPDDPLAFPLGVALENVTPGASPTITQVATIPLPGGLPLYLGALGAFFAIRRLRRAA